MVRTEKHGKVTIKMVPIVRGRGTQNEKITGWIKMYYVKAWDRYVTIPE